MQATGLKKEIWPHLPAANLLTPSECSLVLVVYTYLCVALPWCAFLHRAFTLNVSLARLTKNGFTALFGQPPFTVLAIQAANAPQFLKIKPLLSVEDLSSLTLTPKLKTFLKEVAQNIANKGKSPLGTH